MIYSTFILIFAKKSPLTISVAIIVVITTKMAILANLAIMAWPNMVTDMVNIDFFANVKINVDQHSRKTRLFEDRLGCVKVVL